MVLPKPVSADSWERVVVLNRLPSRQSCGRIWRAAHCAGERAEFRGRSSQIMRVRLFLLLAPGLGSLSVALSPHAAHGGILDALGRGVVETHRTSPEIRAATSCDGQPAKQCHTIAWSRPRAMDRLSRCRPRCTGHRTRQDASGARRAVSGSAGQFARRHELPAMNDLRGLQRPAASWRRWERRLRQIQPIAAALEDQRNHAGGEHDVLGGVDERLSLRLIDRREVDGVVGHQRSARPAGNRSRADGVRTPRTVDRRRAPRRDVP